MTCAQSNCQYFEIVKYVKFRQKAQELNLESEKKNLNSVNKQHIFFLIMSTSKPLKAYRLSELNFFFILKVANIRCFILIAVEIFHNIIHK